MKQFRYQLRLREPVGRYRIIKSAYKNIYSLFESIPYWAKAEGRKLDEFYVVDTWENREVVKEEEDDEN